jgi:hypothetical protein
VPRAKRPSNAVTAPPRRKKTRRRAVPERRLATSETRAEFSKLVNELAEREDAAESLVDNAVEVGPQRKGGVWMVPEVDGQAAVERIEELEEAVDSLEDEMENVAIAMMLQERLEQSSGKVTSGAQVIRELGFEDLAEGLPE